MDFNTEESLIRKWNLMGPRKEELKELDLLSRHGITSDDNGDVDCSLRLGLPSGNTCHSSITSHPYPPQADYNHGFMTVGSAFCPWNLHRSDGLLWSADVAGNWDGDGNNTVINGFIDFFGVTPLVSQKTFQKSNSTEVHSGESSVNIKRCAFCRKSSTPLWRNGPSGRKTLCNACGIRFKKQEKKALKVRENPRNGV